MTSEANSSNTRLGRLRDDIENRSYPSDSGSRKNGRVERGTRLFSTILCLSAVLVSCNLYGSISVVLGLHHSTSIFSLYSFFIAALSMVLFLFSWPRTRYSQVSYIFLCIVAVIACFSLFTYLTSNNAAERNAASYFLVFALPGYLLGTLLSSGNHLKTFVKYCDVAMIILAVGGLAFISIGANSSPFEFSMGYQDASYTASLSIGINVILLTYPLDSYRFAPCRTFPYRILQFVLMAVAFFCAIAAGGRGGIILALLFFVFFIVRSVSIKKFSKRIGVFLIIAVIVATALAALLGSDYLQAGAKRFLMLFDDNALSSTSDAAINSISSRNVTRSRAFELIYGSPLFGSGLFSYYEKLGGYPHNIVLEILLQGGLVYLLLVTFFFIFLVHKARQVYCERPLSIMIAAPAIYAFVMLLFSGTYLSNSQFWIALGFYLASMTDGA